MPLRRTTAIATACCLALAFAGCGGDDDEAGGADTTTTTTEAPAPEPLTIMVTNDDGIGHEGIDTLVTALEGLEEAEIIVVAPAEDRTGASDKKTSGAVTFADAATVSGHEGTAVDGFPADTVTVALDELGLEPDLVVSGINQGQNVGPLAYLSGTVGAAREAVRRGVPAIAGSAGIVEDADYASAAELIVAYIEEHRAELADGSASTEAVVSFNVPQCTAGEPRELVEVPLATEVPEGVDPFKADCSLEPDGEPADDVMAVSTGYPAVSPVPPEPASG